MPKLKITDPKIYHLIHAEERRQKNTLGMIASENYVSLAVREANGSVLNNKYSEGYPKMRYYQGNNIIDKIEQEAINRACKLFKAEHANVQPFSGALANMASFEALLKDGDRVLSMELTQGGHLTHGSKVNFSGKRYDFYFYSVDQKSGLIDYKNVEALAKKIKPKLILAGTTSYPRKIDFCCFSRIAKSVQSYFMADIAHIAGLIIAGLHPNPAPYADIVTFTTHKTLRGPRGAVILCKKKHAQAIDRAIFPALQAGPLEHIIAAKAVCFKEANTQQFKKYQAQIVKNAKALERALKRFNFKLVTDGTDLHMLVINLAESLCVKEAFQSNQSSLTGAQAAIKLEEFGIVCNKNTVPFDQLSPMVTSGIRLGTPTLTTRGMREAQMKQIAKWIFEILVQEINQKRKDEIKKEILNLCKKFMFKD